MITEASKADININSDMFSVFTTSNTSTVSPLSYIYDVDEDMDLQEIVTAYVNCELADGDHDLQRKGDQTNPLIEYCNKNIGKQSYINGKFIDFSYNYSGDCTSQSAIKKKMEELIKDKTFNSRLPLEKTTQKIPKKLVDLQHFLLNQESNPNGFGKIQSSIVETHRGGIPNSGEDLSIYSTMYKSQLTTTFDLGSNVNFVNLDIGEIIETVDKLKTITPLTSQLPLLRFYPNYFPNAFSVFIRINDSNDENKINEIISQYFKDEISQEASNNIKGNFYDDKIKKMYKLPSDVNRLFLLHMFSDKNNSPTYSLQYGQVKADEVTMQLYGEKKRSILGCFNSRKSFQPSGIIFGEGMSFEMQCCHILYAKTCGDGVTIEAANMYSYLKKETTNVLSNDFCCNLRASFVTGFSTRQAPTSLAATGLGLFSQKRDVEFFKSTTISGGKTIKQIYADNIVKSFGKINFNGGDNNYDDILNKLKEYIKTELVDEYKENEFLGYYVHRFVGKKMDELREIIPSCAELIQKVLQNKLNINDDKNLFDKVGKFNLDTIKAEVDEYASSFGKIILKFNNEFHLVFINRGKNIQDDIIAKHIEYGISFVSSIEEKLKECITPTTYVDNDNQSQNINTAQQYDLLSTEQVDITPTNYKEIVFVFLSTFLNDTSKLSIETYCGSITKEIFEIIKNLNLTNSQEIIEKLNKILMEPLGDFNEKLKEFYTFLLKSYNDENVGIFKIQSDDEKYPIKCELKQRINLLKFIVRYNEFIVHIKNDKVKLKIINKQINTKSLTYDLKSKVSLLITDGGYKKLQELYKSPNKTPNKPIAKKIVLSPVKFQTDSLSSSSDTASDLDSQETVLGTGSETPPVQLTPSPVQLTPTQVQSIPPLSTPPGRQSTPNDSLVFKSNTTSVNTSPFQQSPMRYTSDEPVCRDTDDDLEEVLPPIEEADEEKEFSVKLTLFGNIFSELINEFRNFEEIAEEEKSASEELNSTAKQAENKVYNAAAAAAEQALGSVDDIDNIQAIISDSKNEAITEIQNEKKGILDRIRNFFRKRRPHESTNKSSKTPKFLSDIGGSRKHRKKTHKNTRRKNSKSPKRKTIKKIKMSKRKNKTRRQRK